MPDLDVFMEGNKLIVEAAFRVPDDEGALTDPTAVVFTARRRGGAATEYVLGTDPEVTNPSTGLANLTFVPEAGHWWVHVQGTGDAYGAREVEFDVDGSKAKGTET